MISRPGPGLGQSDPWFANGLPTRHTAGFLALLRNATAEGLDPERYALTDIETALAQAEDAEARARASGLLSSAYRAYARDLRVPSIAPRPTYVDPGLAPQPTPLDPASTLDRLRQLHDRNPIYRDLRAGLEWYRARWSGLPQEPVPAGPPLALGSSGERVAALRRRLGLPASDRFDAPLGQALREFRQVHGLAPAPVADGPTIAALNRGAAYYERLIAINLDRTRALPVDGRRFIVVDTAGAWLRMIENGREVGAMRVVVGRPPMETPELAGLIRFAIVNPYWNLPPDVVRRSVAPRVQREGPGYLARHRYVLFSDWRDTAVPLEPDQVDWSMVAAGLQKVWVRQLPGGDNMMGDVKFMLPNRLGIYLHDTPRKRDFARSDRRLSSGCVRVEDAPRLARWLLGYDALERGEGTPETRIDLPRPVPVYITYLTAVPEGGRLRFQQDVYGRDEALMPAVGNLS